MFFIIMSCTYINNVNDIKFEQVLENYFQESLYLYKITGTYQGDPRYNDTLPNFLSDDFIVKEKKFYRKFLNKMNSYDNSILSEDELLNKNVLLWECEMNLKRLQFPKDLMPIDQMWGFQLSMGQLASGMGAQPFKNLEDYRNWLVRVDGYLEWLKSAKINMTEGIKIGWVLPKSLIKKVLPQLKVMTNQDIENHLFYKPVLNFPETIKEDDRKKLINDYYHMIKNKIIPAYNDLYSFMSNEYFESGRETSGYNSLKGGKDYYDYAIKYYTTTNLSPDEIHQLGLNEVKRIRSEMLNVKNSVGFKGSLNDFFKHVRTLKKLMPFDKPDQVIDNFNSIHERMLPYVNNLFELQPKTPFEVRRTEAFREASAAAQYNPGSLDGTRPGIFYVPIPNVKKYNTYSDEDLFLHEAIPGHHYQISLQQENELLASFRKDLWYSSYGEGWALYAESLGSELGLYKDPYQYFGMLSAEIHRAIRLVVDTGIHSKGWSRERAIEYSLNNEAESIESITSEIERYMANPGQALSYKIGQLKIQELRDNAQKVLGDNFDIKVFHRKILESGCIPLQLLEKKINKWIELEKG
ncbi:MAG: DUF885 domain-containing protein [Flavobacteriaceae bacterium]